MIRSAAKLRRVFTRVTVLALVVLGLPLAVTQVVFAAPPVAVGFTVTPTVPLPGQSATFLATGTKQGDSVSWDFENDGTFDATGFTVQHAYATPGQRTVLMRVRRGVDVKDVLKIVRVDAPPVASFAFFPGLPRAGDTVYFTSTSSDTEGDIASHAWDLDGDGQFDDSFSRVAPLRFGDPGIYAVSLRVTDTRGAADVESRAVPVSARLASVPSELMRPFPVVRIVGRSTRSGARIKFLAVRGVPRGAQVTVRCRGAGCGRRRQSKQVRSGSVRFRSFERALRAGARIQVFITQAGKIGKYTSFKIRLGRTPLRRDLCVTSKTARPLRCPVS